MKGMDKNKPVHTVDHIEKQIKEISNKLGDISPISQKKEAERIEKKIEKKRAFFDKCKIKTIVLFHST